MLNRYYGWYQVPGHLEIISIQLSNDLIKWSSKYEKPIIISEYGADAMPGLHCYPEVLFCEEYQETLIREHHAVFDTFRNKSILYGELVWNFIEFMTGEDTNVLRRVYGNRKGLFTRDRQPKSAAFIVKDRYDSFKN
jgi:beta-glucuronidase